MVTDTLVLSDDSDDMQIDAKPSKPSSKKSTPTVVKRKAVVVDTSEDDDDETYRKATGSATVKKKVASPPKAVKNGSANKKKKTAIKDESESESESDSDDDKVKGKGKGKGKAIVKDKRPPAKKTKMEENGDDEEEKPKPKPKWPFNKSSAGPSAPGSKEIPDAKENCLVNLTFVFTGELESLSRESGQDLVKRYGGRVTTAPSSKTSYVVLGKEAGPKKLEMIAKHKIKTLSEDEFLALLGSRPSGENDPKYQEAKKKEEEKVAQTAKEIKVTKEDNLTQLWTVKYAPTKLTEICGNKGSVEKLSHWLEAWPASLKKDFKKPGPDAMGGFRCVLISGPPGIGKTTAAHLVAKLLGYSVLELNASDTRSKKLLETAFKSTIENTTLAGFYKTNDSSSVANPSVQQKSVIIMDEVDGMSSGDRGGVGALNALIRKTKVPIIAICNDKSTPKMKPLTTTCFQMGFKRPSAQEIRSRMMSIAFKEGIKLEGKVMDQLVGGANSDIRQIVNMLSTWKLGSKAMSFDDGKKMAKMSEKNQIQTPWSLYNKLFSPQAFSSVSGMTLNDKLDLYFAEHSLLPLFVQDNYLKIKFTKAAGFSGREKQLKDLELIQKCSEAISDGDLVDSMIHGGTMHWTLMPVHGMLSCVRPASYCYGQNSSMSFGFPTWFGKNSTQGKLQRLLGEIQIRMRLRVSGDRKEIRQSYIPILFEKLVKPLREKGMEGIEQVIALMDDYFLTKEDWDAIVELGIGADHDNDAVLKTIPSATKSAFTRTYNKNDHPVPFYRDAGGRPKKVGAAAGELPDTEDVQVEDEEGDDDEDDGPSGEEADHGVSKDKLIKAKKPGKVAAAKKK